MKLKQLEDRLRQLVRDSKVTRYRIWKETGITESVLSRFARGGSASLETLDGLIQYFGLQVEVKRKRQKKAGK